MRQNKPVKIGALSAKEFDWLKDQPDLTPEEKAKVEEYKKIKPSEDLGVRRRDRKKLLITKKLLWDNFQIFYKYQTGKEFEKTGDSLKNIGAIINYFAKDPDFFKSEHLITKVGNSELKPSIDKGLLIIGNYGNGKTTIMRTLAKMFNHYSMPMKFQTKNAHEVVTEYETLSNPGDKDLFYERYKTSALHLDDVKKEQTANNYGKLEIVRALLEKRYDAKLITHITCNFREGDSTENISDGLSEFGERYGEHIYDRLFEMFNIVHFKGKSFR